MSPNASPRHTGWRMAPLLVACLALAACGDDTPAPSAARVDPVVDLVSFAVSNIVVNVDPSEDKGAGDARRKAWRLHERIVAGEPFAEVALDGSDVSTKVDGGFVGFVAPHHDTAFAGAIRALAPGQTSLPIRGKQGFLIVHRHPFAEGARLEREHLMPVYGFVVPVAQGADPADARDQTERILAQIRAGEITLTEARDLHGPRQKAGAQPVYYGMVSRRDGFEPIYDALKDVPPGTIAGPIPLEVGFAIVQRGEHLRAVLRHILIKHRGADLSFGRSQEDALRMAKRALARIKAAPQDWERHVRDFSDDAQTRGDGGTWRAIESGSLPLALEEAVRDTPPGALVPRVVESPAGYHIILRVN